MAPGSKDGYQCFLTDCLPVNLLNLMPDRNTRSKLILVRMEEIHVRSYFLLKERAGVTNQEVLFLGV